jgi:hypothetical protein
LLRVSQLVERGNETCTTNGRITVTVQPYSLVAVPVTIAVPERKRPDRRAVPVGSDGLVAPGPPPLNVDALVRVKGSDLPGCRPRVALVTRTSPAAEGPP